MRVGHKIAMHAGSGEQFPQHFGMTLGWRWQPYWIGREPSRHTFPRRSHRHGRPDYSWIRHKPQISEQACPRQANGSGATELVIEPRPGCLMLVKSRDARVNEHVDINEYHLKPSPSA